MSGTAVCRRNRLYDELILNLGQVKLEVVADELLPSVLEVEKDVFSDIFLLGRRIWRCRLRYSFAVCLTKK